MEYSGNGTRKSVKRTAWGVSYSVKQLLSTSPCYRTDISRTGTSQSSKIAKQEMFWKPGKNRILDLHENVRSCISVKITLQLTALRSLQIVKMVKRMTLIRHTGFIRNTPRISHHGEFGPNNQLIEENVQEHSSSLLALMTQQ
jgi:hypothetical protein